MEVAPGGGQRGGEVPGGAEALPPLGPLTGGITCRKRSCPPDSVGRGDVGPGLLYAKF